MEIKLTEEERKKRISSPESVYPIFQSIIDREKGLDLSKEHFWVMGLHKTGFLMYLELVALGSANRVFVSATDVYHFAVDKKAGSIILAHNHPSGNLQFTNEDLKLSEYLIQVGKFMAIDVLDHLIITDNSYSSLKLKGLYDEMYFHPTCLNEHVRQEIERVQLRKKIREEFDAKMEKQIKSLYKNGVGIDKIADSLDMRILDISLILEIV